MTERITGSRAHRIIRCPASAVLPHVEHDRSSPAADRGTAIHAFLEVVRTVGPDAAIARAPAELRPFLAAIDVESLPTHLATEVSFAFDWRSRRGRELGRGIGRDYAAAAELHELGPLTDSEDCLTVDILGHDRAAGVAYVGDYKTGRSRYPMPDKFAQTMLAAAAVRSALGVSEVRLELIYIDDEGDDFRTRSSVDEWAIDDWCDEWATARGAIAGLELEHAAGRPLSVRDGDHCDHCPAFNYCPGKTALVRALPTSVDEVLASGYMSRDRMAAAWRACERLKDLIGTVQSQICMAATIEPLELGDGEILGPKTTVRETLRGEIAAAVLGEWHGAEAVKEAITISMSKDALRSAVVARKKEGEKISTKKRDGVLDRIEAEIRRRDGYDQRVSYSVGISRPRKVLKSGDE